jgi:basic membrane lipoprotein Med (substrate-binding protein (PBP1-ABC) superfamily)
MFKKTLKGLAALALIGFASIGPAQAEDPTELGIGFILSTGPEAAWDGTLLRDIDAVKAEKPHGLDINYKNVDGVWGEQAGDAMKLLAKTGKYQIIWAHSSYSDQVAALKDEFPEILFVVVGSGNKGLGDNVYWDFKRAHEPSYLLGVLAGRLTKSNTIGVVGQFPSEDVNDQINGFFAGAKSVNPDIRHKIAFIESWYDPAKAEQFTNAQIAAGADLTFQLVASFETCEKANIMCFGNYQDEGMAAPKSVVASAMISWKPDLEWIIDEWWNHKTKGTPYNGNAKERWFSMAEGGSSLSGYNAYESELPAALKEEVEAISARIKSGELVIPVDLSVPTSN